MAITRRPTPTAKPAFDPAAADKFINAAPDAGTAPASVAEAPPTPTRTHTVRGKQLQVTFALPPELLAKVDEVASSLSISRAAFIKQALTRAVQAEGG